MTSKSLALHSVQRTVSVLSGMNDTPELGLSNGVLTGDIVLAKDDTGPIELNEDDMQYVLKFVGTLVKDVVVTVPNVPCGLLRLFINATKGSHKVGLKAKGQADSAAIELAGGENYIFHKGATLEAWSKPSAASLPTREKYRAEFNLLTENRTHVDVPAQNVEPFTYMLPHTIPAGRVVEGSRLLMVLSAQGRKRVGSSVRSGSFGVLFVFEKSSDGGKTWGYITNNVGYQWSYEQYSPMTDVAYDQISADEAGKEIRYRCRVYHWINQEASRLFGAKLHIIEI